MFNHNVFFEMETNHIKLRLIITCDIVYKNLGKINNSFMQKKKQTLL